MGIRGLFTRSGQRSADDDGVVVGRRSDGDPVRFDWPMQHGLVSGVTGSGKGSWQSGVIGNVAGMEDVAVVAIDMKGGVELAPWEPRLSVLAASPSDATKLLSDVQRMVETRAALLRSLGRREWSPDLGPSVLFVIDELAEMAALDPKALAAAIADPKEGKKLHLVPAKDSAAMRLDILASIVRLSRFVHVSVLAATQYPLASVVPSELRSNLTLKVMGRVTSSEMVNVALGAGMASQVSADAIGPHEQGVAYVLGAKGFEKPTRARAFFADDDAIEARAKATAKHRVDPTVLFDFKNDEQEEGSVDDEAA